MKSLNYDNFLNTIKFDNVNYPIELIQDKINFLERIPEFTLGSVISYFVLDYNTRKYSLLSKTPILGYPIEALIEGGLDFVIDIYHKTDFSIFNNQIFSKNLELIQSIAPDQQHEYYYNFSFRVHDKFKKLRTILQRNQYIVNPINRLPQFCIGTSCDITDYYNSTSMIWSVHKNNLVNGRRELTQIINERFYPNNEDQKFTKRELEILLMLSDGLIVKEIAKKLNLAERTIINHKHNMYTKSNSRSIGALLKYGFINGLI